jgi:hypothetical protein
MVAIDKTTLEDVLRKVRDEKLSLPQLEAFRDSLIHFKTDLLKTVAEYKKQRALFLMHDPEKSVALRKMEWDATPMGLLLIGFEADLRGLPDEIDALMSRIYSAIR